MLKLDVLTGILQAGLVGVVRADSGDQALRISDALVEGGVGVIEIALTVPGAPATIARLRQGEVPGVLIGAGTVIDAETARIAILEGAEFLVGPNVDARTARVANRYGIPYVAGAGTPGGIVRAMELGSDIVKIFPADTLGPGFLKSVLGPLPQASLMPTGGISPDNVGDWFAAGAVAVGTGGSLTAAAENGDLKGVTAMARRFVDAVRSARA